MPKVEITNASRRARAASAAARRRAPARPAPRPEPAAERRPSPVAERWVRLLNFTVALAGIVLTAPLMLIIAVLVKATSPGPILFVQPRIGLDRRARGTRPVHEPGCRRRVDLGGRPFRIYKFRTMRVDLALRNVWARRDDPRITPVGRFLRRTRLDELPQLFNVLRGDMNVVGPRPEQPRIFLELVERIEGYGARQAVLPGITGWAQVNCGYDQCLDDVRRKLAYDLEYIQRRSVVQDVRIMARTLPVMLFRKGAI